MPTNTKNRPAADSIDADQQLGLAILMLADEEDNREPVGVVSTISEAREIAASDLDLRRRRIENDEDPGLCPYEYYVYVNGTDGYRITASFLAAEL